MKMYKQRYISIGEIFAKMLSFLGFLWHHCYGTGLI